MPYPGLMKFLPRTFVIITNNWIDFTGEYPAHAHEFRTEYFTTDLLLTLMFLRVYILFGALL